MTLQRTVTLNVFLLKRREEKRREEKRREEKRRDKINGNQIKSAEL